MYERFFGFEERPFELTANPRYLFLTERYREALGTLTYGLSSRKGMLVMTGEAGTGKTTMLTVAMAGLHADQLVVYLSNPTLTRAEFIEFMTAKLGLPESVGASKTRFLAAVTQLLETRADAELLTALVIDEAHSLPNELLEEVRLLANIERPDRKLLTVVLVGQPELAGRLNEPALRQLKQRVALRCELVPLTLRESAAYIAKRISLAGGDSAQVFTREAVLAVYEYSGGIPRMINVLCDNALVNAYARDEHLVSVNIVEEVARDFDLQARVHVADGDSSRQPAAGPPPVTRQASAPATQRVQVARGAAAATGHAGHDRRPEAMTAMASVPASRPAIQGTHPGSILDLRPANSLAGARYEPAPEPRRSFWSTLQFWKR
jgi:general secretion pathway protein A